MTIADYPVLTGSQRQTCQYTYRRETNRQTFEYAFAQAVSTFRVRLGPLAPGATVQAALVGNLVTPFEMQDSGDSRWVWVNAPAGKQGKLTVELQAPVK